MKEEKKFELTTETKIVFGRKLFRIKALVDIDDRGVKKGDLGGFIEKENNLSGNAWVYDNARVYGNAEVYDNAEVYGNARVSGNAWVYDNARVYGNAEVYDNAEVYGNARVSGDARVYDNAEVYGNARVSGDARVYGDARLIAKAAFTKGRFIGGDDSGKITDITAQTGSDYWRNQYVLGDYEIKPIKEENTEEESDTQAEEFDPGMVVNRLDAIEKRLSKLESSENE